MQPSQMCNGIEELYGCRQWYIQIVIFPHQFDLPYVFKSERVLVGNYAVPNMIGYVVEKKVVSV